MSRDKLSSTVFFEGKDLHFDLIKSANPDAPLTLLLGGVLQDRASWKNYVREFSKYSDVLILDLPGIGASGVLPSNYGFDFLAESVNHVLEHLKIEQVNIFSTSYSTIIAFEFSQRYAFKVNNLALSSSMTHLPPQQLALMEATLVALKNGDLQKFSDLFYRGISAHLVRPQNADLVERVIRNSIRAMTQTQIQQFCENTKRVINYERSFQFIQKIDLNPFIFTGALDTFTPPGLCREVGKCFTKFQFRTIPGFDHFFHIGNTQLIFKTLIPFMLRSEIPDFEQVIDDG